MRLNLTAEAVFECATFLMIHIRYLRALRILIRFWRLRLSSFAK